MKNRSFIVLALTAVLFARPAVADWTPGAINPDWPHVIAAEVEGQYKPMLGWKFANDEPGDFSVVPVVPAEDVVLGPTNGPNVTIPAPAESLPISAIPAWQEMFGALDAQNPFAVTPGHWIDVVAADKIVESYIQVPKPYYGRTCSYSDFLALRRELKSESAMAERRPMGEAKRAIKKQYGESGVETPDVTGVKTIKFEELDERSCLWTFLRMQTEKFGDRVVKSITVTTSIGLWANQNQFSLGVSSTATDSENVEVLATEMQRRALGWAEAVYSASGETMRAFARCGAFSMRLSEIHCA